MKIILNIGLAVALCGLTQSVHAQDCDPTTSAECAAASQVGTDIETALHNANAAGLNGLVLKKAVLTLETGSTVKGGINISFLIFTIKHTTSKGSTISQVLTWGELPKPAGAGPTNLATLTDVLSRSIGTAAALASKVTTLPLTEAAMTLKFVVDKDNSGSLSYKILGVNLGPSVDVDKTSTNTLAVTFAPTTAHTP